MAKWKEIPSPEAIVRAALDRAAIEADAWFYDPRAGIVTDTRLINAIRALASDPAEVAAIISAAAQLKKAEEDMADVSRAASTILSGGISKIAPAILNTVYSESIKWQNNQDMIRGRVPQETVTLAMFEQCLLAIANLAELKGEDRG